MVRKSLIGGPPLCGSTHDGPAGCRCGSALDPGNIIVGHRGESTFCHHAHELPRETSPAGSRRYPEPFERHCQECPRRTMIATVNTAEAEMRSLWLPTWRSSATTLRTTVGVHGA
jgi:hypothetical protein